MLDIKNDELMKAIEAFYFAYREFTAGPDQILSNKKLNRVHHRILYFVGRNPEININELLSILNVSKQALNAPLRVLLDKGLIKSQLAEHDKRIKQLSLSARGRKLESELTETQMNHLKNIFSDFDARAFSQWLAVMERASEVNDN